MKMVKMIKRTMRAILSCSWCSDNVLGAKNIFFLIHLVCALLFATVRVDHSRLKKSFITKIDYLR